MVSSSFYLCVKENEMCKTDFYPQLKSINRILRPVWIVSVHLCAKKCNFSNFRAIHSPTSICSHSESQTRPGTIGNNKKRLISPLTKS